MAANVVYGKFDWIRFLRYAGIDFVEGPAKNVGAGHVGVPCPLCTDDDGFHFGIRLKDGKIRGCWRPGNHWLSPPALIQYLLRIEFSEALKILQDGEIPDVVSVDDMHEAIRLMDPPKFEFEKVSWPKEARTFEKEASGGAHAFRYLRNRGFNPATVGRRYDLRYCIDGRFAARILIPLFNKDQKMIGWTGRAITRAEIKYDTYPPGEGVSHVVYQPRNLRTGHLLVLVEGPFDALKIDCLGYLMGVTALALLGLKESAGKIGHVQEIAQGFDRVVIVLDSGEEARALEIQSSLVPMDAQIRTLPSPFDDPGELTKNAGKAWLKAIIDE